MVGGGVIGLTTAVLLAEEGVRVRVLSRDAAAATTSAVAGGLCWPYRIAPVQRAIDWSVRSFPRFAELAAHPGATGVRIRSGTMIGDPAPEAWTALVGDPPRTPLVDMTTYLRYLCERLESAGGHLEQRTCGSLREAAEEAPLVLNCTGLGARELVPDGTLEPVRGQLVIAENPGIEEWYVSAASGSAESTYILPQPFGVILGGTAEPGADGTEPDPAIAEAIIERCARVRPRLAGAAVLAHRVGLRPYRPRVRLEAERLPNGALCVHHYGHGGAGITTSWASAEDAVRLTATPYG